MYFIKSETAMTCTFADVQVFLVFETAAVFFEKS